MKTKNSSRFSYMPRVVCKMNTGSRVIWSKKDKLNTRRALNRATKEIAYG